MHTCIEGEGNPLKHFTIINNYFFVPLILKHFIFKHLIPYSQLRCCVMCVVHFVLEYNHSNPIMTRVVALVPQAQSFAALTHTFMQSNCFGL